MTQLVIYRLGARYESTIYVKSDIYTNIRCVLYIIWLTRIRVYKTKVSFHSIRLKDIRLKICFFSLVSLSVSSLIFSRRHWQSINFKPRSVNYTLEQGRGDEISNGFLTDGPKSSTLSPVIVASHDFFLYSRTP